MVVEADGDLSVAKLVDGNLGTIVGLTGDLTVTPPGGAAVPLDGSLAAVAEADGDLSVSKLVEGDADIVVGLAGGLSATKPISGKFNVSTKLTGDLTVTPSAGGVDLDGTAGVVVGLAGELSVTQGLAGEIDLVVELAGDLAIPTTLQLEGTVEVVVGVGPLAELFVQRPQGVAPRRLWRTSRVY
jgi:hypothetical protein